MCTYPPSGGVSAMRAASICLAGATGDGNARAVTNANISSELAAGMQGRAASGSSGADLT